MIIISLSYLSVTDLQINDWLEDLLNERSDDIYRMKGVLSIDGFNARFVFQVYHVINCKL